MSLFKGLAENKERKKARDGQTVSANSSIDEKEFAKAKDSVFSSRWALPFVLP